MQAGLHAVGLGFQRLGILIGIVVICGLLAYVGLVFVLVVIQAASSFAQ